jgi:hypothetical protein
MRLPMVPECAIIEIQMKTLPSDGRQLITLAQKLARDAERHAILSASLASQADRLMLAGLKILQSAPMPPAAAPPPPARRL